MTNTSSVRMGPISIFTLIIVLCLAVMAVLSFATAHATQTVAQRQASFATDTYTNEIAGQEFIQAVDTYLTEFRNDNVSTTAETDSDSTSWSYLRDSAVAGLSSMGSNLAPNARNIVVEGNTLTATFMTDSGRRLIVEIRINDDATFTIIQWKASTRQSEATTTDEQLLTVDNSGQYSAESAQ